LNLQYLANIAEILGALLVIIGVFFGLIEIRHYRQQRQEAAAMEIMRAFQSHDFTRALGLVMDYEQECRQCREGSMPQELQDSAMLVSTTLEAVGLMVYQRIVPFRLVQQLMGGTIQAHPGSLAGAQTPHRVVEGETLPPVPSRVVPVAVGAAG